MGDSPSLIGYQGGAFDGRTLWLAPAPGQTQISPWVRVSAISASGVGSQVYAPSMSEERRKYLLALSSAASTFGEMRQAVAPASAKIYPANSHWRDYDAADRLMRLGNQRAALMRAKRRQHSGALWPLGGAVVGTAMMAASGLPAIVVAFCFVIVMTLAIWVSLSLRKTEKQTDATLQAVTHLLLSEKLSETQREQALSAP